ncbi:hypothetical protein [Amaricoccus tamworthensis]|uniref:hypothetical protein n=1 Tax=Amaricoccus tamworthensis TaxID=57002 RepID=UPI003C79DFC0
MMLFFKDRSVYARAVRDTADKLLAAHGKVADVEAWKAARMPSLTKSERSYCEAVAIRVSQQLGNAPAAAG